MTHPNNNDTTGKEESHNPDGSVEKIPDKCGSCGSTDVRAFPMEDMAICHGCGYKYLGIPRNRTHGRDWNADEYDNAELLRDG
jgi:hypothetical protein